MKIKKMKQRHQTPTDILSSSIPPPPWLELPVELTTKILSHVSVQDRLNYAQLVCKTWWKVCMDPHMWRVINMNLGIRSAEELKELTYDVGKMYLHALERSHGQLEETTLEFFCTNELLYQICHRASELKCLTLHGFSRSRKLTFPNELPIHANIDLEYSARGTGRSLRKLVRKLTNLEELHFFCIPSMSGRHLAPIGYSCPKLKSFSFNQRKYGYQYLSPDEYAQAVAESMPNLHQLSLFGNSMTNNGLQAILDGCSRLESLDIRECYGVVLEGDLQRRCSEQIKHLRCPYCVISESVFAPAICFT